MTKKSKIKTKKMGMKKRIHKTRKYTKLKKGGVTKRNLDEDPVKTNPQQFDADFEEMRNREKRIKREKEQTEHAQDMVKLSELFKKDDPDFGLDEEDRNLELEMLASLYENLEETDMKP